MLTDTDPEVLPAGKAAVATTVLEPQF